MGRPSLAETRPCELCRRSVTRTGREQHGRKFWACKPEDRDCVDQLREQCGGRKANPYKGQTETRLCSGCWDASRPITYALTPRNRLQIWYHDPHCKGVGETRRRMDEGTWVRPTRPRTGESFLCEGFDEDGNPCAVVRYFQPAYIKQYRRYHDRDCWNRTQRLSRIKKPCEYALCDKGPMILRPSELKQRFHAECEHRAKIKRPTGRDHNGRAVIQNAQGYLTIYEPTHPNANKVNGRVLEHRWVVEQDIGRLLDQREQVNHKNHQKTDNRIENLEILDPTAHQNETVAWTQARHRQTEIDLAEHQQRLAEEQERVAVLQRQLEEMEQRLKP